MTLNEFGRLPTYVVCAQILTYYLLTRYEPLFPYFEKTHPFKQNCWKILLAEYVTAENGTCMVHQAPAFGEDDYNVPSI